MDLNVLANTEPAKVLLIGKLCFIKKINDPWHRIIATNTYISCSCLCVVFDRILSAQDLNLLGLLLGPSCAMTGYVMFGN